MTSEESKGREVEIPIFLEFIASGDLPLDLASVKKGKLPAPDILCRSKSGEEIAFELVEICDHNMARNKTDGAYIRTTDPTLEIFKKKLGKRYVTNAPIELLCYTNGRVVSPDSYIAEQVISLLLEVECQYRRVWLFGRRGVRLLWERGS